MYALWQGMKVVRVTECPTVVSDSMNDTWRPVLPAGPAALPLLVP